MQESQQELVRFLADHHAACPGCGYDLHRAVAGVCPECGRAIVLSELLLPRLPTPKNDLLVLSIVGMCGLLVATIYGGFAAAGAVVGGGSSIAGLAVVGLAVGELWVLVIWLRRPHRFTSLARPLQWILALSLGGTTLAGIAAMIGIVIWVFATTFL